MPVTRMVRECVNETRTVTCYTPQQEMVTKPVTRYVCEPTTVVQKSYRPVPVTKIVQRTIYQTYCTTEMVNKTITRMIPECVTETVPVTKNRKVVEPQLCYVTQRIPTTSYVPVVTCGHSCGHRCSGGCGQCGGATACVQYRPVTTCTYQQVPVMKPTVRFVPETCYVQRTRTKYNPVQETVTVPVKKINRVPCAVVNQCVTDYQMQAYDCTVTKMVARPVTETVTVCQTKMIPHSQTVTVPVVKLRPVTDMVTRQTSVCVPYQVPVTVMTTQTRPVGTVAPAAQSASGFAPDRSEPVRRLLTAPRSRCASGVLVTTDARCRADPTVAFRPARDGRENFPCCHHLRSAFPQFGVAERIRKMRDIIMINSSGKTEQPEGVVG